MIKDSPFFPRRFAKKLHACFIKVAMRVILELFGFEEVCTCVPFLDKRSTEIVLRMFGASLGENCSIESSLRIHNARVDFSNLMIGNYCHIGKDVFLDLADKIIIEDLVTVSMRTTVITHTDVGRSPLRKGYFPNFWAKPVVIKKGAYLGANVTVLPGVTIGECCVVGAASLVNKDVNALTVIAGVPAKELGKVRKNMMI